MTLCRPECDVRIVTVGTRNVSAVTRPPGGTAPAPSEVTKISMLPFFRSVEGTVSVGTRALGMISDCSPYLPTVSHC